MKYVKASIVLSSLMAVTAFGQTATKFVGDCRSTVEGSEPQLFDLEVKTGQSTILPIIETDSFATPVVTNVTISFPIGSVLIVRMTTDMPNPYNGDVRIMGLGPHMTVNAQFPLRLGHIAICTGHVR